MDHNIAIRVAGHSKEWPWLVFDPTPTSSSCGAITDGVAFAHTNCEEPQNRQQSQGFWVISFADLERAYFAAFAARMVKA
jgi:hypothetical protein